MTQVEDPYSSDLITQMSLIEQAQANEPIAWEVVFRLYAPLIKRWAREIGVRCPHEIENVCQEVFARLIKNLRSFQKRENTGSFRGWLRVITRNYIYTSYNGTSNLMTVGGSEWHRKMHEIPFDNSENSLLDSAPEEHPDEASLIFQQIMGWVDSEYSARQKTAFKRVVIDQRPAREVAEDLNVSVNIIYQNKSRILARIRKVFGELV